MENISNVIPLFSSINFTEINRKAEIYMYEHEKDLYMFEVVKKSNKNHSIYYVYDTIYIDFSNDVDAILIKEYKAN